MFFSFGKGHSQSAENQEEYLKSSPEKHELNQKSWEKERGSMVKEARGQAESSEVKDYNLRPNDVATESEKEGDFYKYEEEGFEGEYAEYETYDDFEYEEGENYSGGPSEGGNGSENRNENRENRGGGNNNYHPRDRDLDYGENQYHPEEREHRYNRERRSNSSGGGMGILQIILILLLIALLGFLIYQLFMKTSLDDKGKKVVVPLEELEPSEIPKTELELMLEKALADGNYREAVRIYFIFIIKDLSEKEWIRWEKRKTNMSYLVEMRGRSQYNLFDEAVSVFEFVWYGNYKIERSDFQSLEPKFKSLLNSLNKEDK